jgi:OOP family OmpA-OmpF porin
MKKYLAAAVALSFCVASASGQGILNRVKDRVANAAARKAEQEILGSARKKQEQKKSEEKVEPSASQGAETTVPAAAEPETKDAGAARLASKTRFDFVPADKVVFFEDFSQEPVGEFPSKWFTRSKGEVVTLNNATGKWFRLYPGGFLSPTVDMKEDYTVEFDLIMDWPVKGGYLVPSFGVSFYDRGVKSYVFSYDYQLVNNMNVQIVPFRSEAYVTMASRENRKPKFNSDKVKISAFDAKSAKVVHVAFSVQKERVRMWLDEEKVFDIPDGAPYPGNLNQLKVEMNTSNYTNEQIGYYVTNFKVATGTGDLKSKLLSEGKISTTGIKFDINSDRLREESYGTINEIVKTLNENSDLKVRVVGHTDNSGSAADNLILSKKRADAVIKVLTEEYKISSDRLQADGKGSTAPVSENKTAEGRAMNRRVEFIKL